MTTRALYDTTGAFRAQTELLANSPQDTYVCGCCGGYRSIMGRKAMPSPGRRKLYKCARCQKEGK